MGFGHRHRRGQPRKNGEGAYCLTNRNGPGDDQRRRKSKQVLPSRGNAIFGLVRVSTHEKERGSRNHIFLPVTRNPFLEIALQRINVVVEERFFFFLSFLCPPFPSSIKLEASLLKTRSDGSGKKRERRRGEGEEEERQVLELRLIRDL